MKILLASESITDRPREGSHVFLMHLVRFLNRDSQLTVIHAIGEFERDVRMVRALSPKTLVTPGLLRLARRERFDVVLYVPLSGLTSFGIARGILLRLLTKAPAIVIGLQERRIGRFLTLLAAFWKPDLILSPAASVREKLERLGFDTGFIMPGYDDHIFKPATPELRDQLKSKYDLPRDRCILLHVGHVKANRNLEVLLRYRDWGADVQPVVKAGEVDPSWAHRLRRAGIIVIDEFVGDVHELYQASDCYLFPVNSPTGAIEIPLSVIEACACNLPVVTTRFGALVESIHEGNGLLYYDRPAEIAGAIAEVRRTHAETSAKVKEFTWERVFRAHLYPRMQALARKSKGGDPQ
jgi:glycosyltransferase involved in cell wall biosynthesis